MEHAVKEQGGGFSGKNPTRWLVRAIQCLMKISTIHKKKPYLT